MRPEKGRKGYHAADENLNLQAKRAAQERQAQKSHIRRKAGQPKVVGVVGPATKVGAAAAAVGYSFGPTDKPNGAQKKKRRKKS